MASNFQGDFWAKKLGKISILPYSFCGGPHYGVQNNQATMAICKRAGYLDFFFTFIANLKWLKVSYLAEILKGEPDNNNVEVID